MFNATGIVNGLTSTEMGISYLLPRLIGAAHSNDILLTGSAGRRGRGVPHGAGVAGRARRRAARRWPSRRPSGMAKFSPYGLQYSKEACRVGLEIGSLDAAIEFEDRNQLMLGFTDNLPEAIRAFDAGREPVYLDEPRRDIWGDGPELTASLGSRRCRRIRVGVFGAAGRMGATVCRAVADDPQLELVGGGRPVPLRARAVEGRRRARRRPAGVGRRRGVAARQGRGGRRLHRGHRGPREPGVGRPSTASTRWSAPPGSTTPTSSGSGAAFTKSNCVIAPNFAIGAVLMMRFAALAAPYFETAEIIELHHDGKVDAPSGTATLTAERMAAASARLGRRSRPSRSCSTGARGGEGPAGIRIHSVRMRGMVAHQEVILGTTGQTLTIRHDSDRPHVVHARRDAGGEGGRRPPRLDRRPRRPSWVSDTLDSLPGTPHSLRSRCDVASSSGSSSSVEAGEADQLAGALAELQGDGDHHDHDADERSPATGSSATKLAMICRSRRGTTLPSHRNSRPGDRGCRRR